MSKYTRMSGYITPAEKQTLEKELQRIAKLEGLRQLSFGVILSRIAQHRLQFDLKSLKRYRDTHDGE